MQNAVAAGVPVYLNIEGEYTNDDVMTNLFPYATVCQVSLDLPRASTEPFEVARSLLEKGAQIAVVTQGAQGCVIAQGNEAVRVRPLPVEMADGNGAGATLSAGVLYGLRAGLSLEDVGRFGVAYLGTQMHRERNRRVSA